MIDILSAIIFVVATVQNYWGDFTAINLLFAFLFTLTVLGSVFFYLASLEFFKNLFHLLDFRYA